MTNARFLTSLFTVASIARELKAGRNAWDWVRGQSQERDPQKAQGLYSRQRGPVARASFIPCNASRCVYRGCITDSGTPFRRRWLRDAFVLPAVALDGKAVNVSPAKSPAKSAFVWSGRAYANKIGSSEDSPATEFENVRFGADES